MKIEIEAKVVVEDLKPISEAARLAGAESQGTITQHDIYYSDPFGKLLKTGCGLRIRQQNGDVNRTILTFKGPVSKGPYKTRPEIEVEIGSRESMQQLMEGLGYQIVIEIRKKRQSWILGLRGVLDEVEGWAGSRGRAQREPSPNAAADRLAVCPSIAVRQHRWKDGINKITWGKTGKAKPRSSANPTGRTPQRKTASFRRDDRRSRPRNLID
jgi:predicted adenylyl cyclase CyaB